LNRGYGGGQAVADGKPVGTIIGLSPPAVEDREVEGAVEDRLLSRGAAGLLGTTWVVQPDIHSLDQLLAHPVLGVSLAAEDDLHGTVRRLDQIGEPLDVLQDQAGALVGGKP